jgi:hypothetical protein
MGAMKEQWLSKAEKSKVEEAEASVNLNIHNPTEEYSPDQLRVLDEMAKESEKEFLQLLDSGFAEEDALINHLAELDETQQMYEHSLGA